jgi:hypothetical protein
LFIALAPPDRQIVDQEMTPRAVRNQGRARFNRVPCKYVLRGRLPGQYITVDARKSN